MDVKFFNSLFEGDSPNGIRLGMGITGGDFWPRPAGCQNLYRGESMTTIACDEIFRAANITDVSITLPNWVTHQPSGSYFYVVRRANCCGEEENTFGAAVKMTLDASGDLAEPKCNIVFGVRVQQINGNRVKLVWYYWPIEQKAVPGSFAIYSDDGEGEINYQNPIATIVYEGQRFYNWQSGMLSNDRYLLCIRAQNQTGSDDGFPGQIKFQVETRKPEAIQFLQVEAI